MVRNSGDHTNTVIAVLVCLVPVAGLLGFLGGRSTVRRTGPASAFSTAARADATPVVLQLYGFTREHRFDPSKPDAAWSHTRTGPDTGDDDLALLAASSREMVRPKEGFPTPDEAREIVREVTAALERHGFEVIPQSDTRAAIPEAVGFARVSRTLFRNGKLLVMHLRITVQEQRFGLGVRPPQSELAEFMGAATGRDAWEWTREIVPAQVESAANTFMGRRQVRRMMPTSGAFRN